LAEPGKIWRNHVKSISEERDKITEHVARAREAVQQKHLRRVGWSCFAIKNLEAIDISRAISDMRHVALLCL
jgi:hypothetical protein